MSGPRTVAPRPLDAALRQWRETRWRGARIGGLPLIDLIRCARSGWREWERLCRIASRQGDVKRRARKVARATELATTAAVVGALAVLVDAEGVERADQLPGDVTDLDLEAVGNGLGELVKEEGFPWD